MTGQHPVDITIDHRSWQSEGDASNGSCRIIAHTLQLLDGLNGMREMASLNDLSGGVVQVTGTAVIAQPLPFSEHFILRSCSQILNCRPTTHEPLPVVPSLLHLCLLENNL